MPVGATIGSSQMDNIITALAVRLRQVMTEIQQLDLSVNGAAAGLAYMQSIGYSNAENPQNPPDPNNVGHKLSDAQLALNTIAYLNNVAGCYFGTVQQGGSGGTGAIKFNFHQQLASVWAGQVVS